MNDYLVDVLSILSFIIGLENLDMNISQTDLQEETSRLDKKVDEKVNKALNEIHAHLEEQDRKLDIIIGGVYANHKETLKNDKV